MNGCKFCQTPGRLLHVAESAEPRIFINLCSDGYVSVYDEDYPGFTDGFYIYYCPMCGAKLREPPKESEA